MATRKSSNVLKQSWTKKQTVAKVGEPVAPAAFLSKRFTLSANTKRVIIGILVVAILLYMLRGYVFAAIVNGVPITRLSILSNLEKQGGKRVLDQEITESLIIQTAQKEGVSVSNKEVSDQIKKIENSVKKSGQSLDAVLAERGMTRQDLEDQIKIQLIAEKILGKNVTVTDKEIDTFIEQNKDQLPIDATGSALREQVKDQLRSQQIGTKFQTWVTDLKTKAKIYYLVNY